MFGKSSWSLLAIAFFVAAHYLAIAQNGQPLAPSPGDRRLGNAMPLRNPLLRAPLPEPMPVAPTEPVRTPEINGFSSIARAAGMIFSGTVTHVELRPAAGGHSVETVAISFHIENAIRGATPGDNITISQWIGLWSAGQRYRVGERVLLFLYPRSKLGLTSLVAGPLGRFDVDQWNQVSFSVRHLSAFRMDPFLGGKSRLPIRDFASAVRRACEEE